MRRLILFAVAVLSMSGAGAGADDVVAVVSARSPITSLATNHVADIFLGKTSRFPDGTLAVPIDLQEDSPARERFYNQLTGKSPAQMKAHWSKIIFTGRGQPPREVASSAAARKAIADNPNAIGYIDASVKVLAIR